ncbi:MAG: hypothetical protein J0L92_06780 [Deltaproteobacteria bacterium]|nr:hypothetical protein [Deltaproteobacteria bacterium]
MTKWVGAVAVALTLGACGGSGPGPGESCSPSVDECSGETICIGGACEAAFGRVYSITDVQVSVPSSDPVGDAWDAFGGAPDPFIVVAVNGTPIATSATRDDAFGGTFFGPYDATLIGGGSLAIEVWDEDVSANDLMFTCEGSPITASLLRQRTLVCNSGGFMIQFQIDPR